MRSSNKKTRVERYTERQTVCLHLKKSKYKHPRRLPSTSAAPPASTETSLRQAPPETAEDVCGADMSGDFRAKIKFMGQVCDAWLIPWRTSKKRCLFSAEKIKARARGRKMY